MGVNKKILAIDLGGSTAKVAIINEEGKIAFRFKNIKTMKDHLIPNLWKEIENQLPDNINYEAIGFATAGMIDEKNGIILIAGNLNLKNFKLKEEISKYTSKPCFLINDANAAALGEYWVGKGKEYHSLIFYTIGTGIGGAIIINNHLVTGAKGTAGELGHGGNFQNKINCNCGLINCLEPIASATGLKRALMKLSPTITLREIDSDILKNNKQVRNLFKKQWAPLADHMSVMIYALDPEIIIIGGGVSGIGNEVSNLIYSLLQKKVHPSILGNLKVANSILGNDAGIYGAAKIALDSLS